MKHVLCIVLALMVCADAAMADRISIYSDPYGFDCTLVPLPGVNTLYVVHSVNPGALGAEFKVNDNSGLLPLTQTTPYIWIGSFYTGIRMAYGGCVAGDHVIGTLTYLWLETPTTCESSLIVVPFPNEQTIIVYECAEPPSQRIGYGCFTYVGPGGGSCIPFCGCVHYLPTSETTWGAVKALYR